MGGQTPGSKEKKKRSRLNGKKTGVERWDRKSWVIAFLVSCFFYTAQDRKPLFGILCCEADLGENRSRTSAPKSEKWPENGFWPHREHWKKWPKNRNIDPEADLSYFLGLFCPIFPVTPKSIFQCLGQAQNRFYARSANSRILRFLLQLSRVRSCHLSRGRSQVPTKPSNPYPGYRIIIVRELGSYS